MDYYNSMLPQTQPPIMPSMHYSQMAQPEIGQDLWDHEKHVSTIDFRGSTKTKKNCTDNICSLSESRMVKME